MRLARRRISWEQDISAPGRITQHQRERERETNADAAELASGSLYRMRFFDSEACLALLRFFKRPRRKQNLWSQIILWFEPANLHLRLLAAGPRNVHGKGGSRKSTGKGAPAVTHHHLLIASSLFSTHSVEAATQNCLWLGHALRWHSLLQ